MNLKKQNSFIKAMLVIYVISLLNFNLFGLIWANYSPIGFCEECEETTAINNNIITGGGNFLNAYSTTLLILERIERSDLNGIDYGELATLIDQAIFSLKQAVSAYASIDTLLKKLEVKTKKSLSLVALNEIEVERTSQAQIRAGVIDPNPEEDDKCACLCSPGTDRGWREEYKKNNPPT